MNHPCMRFITPYILVISFVLVGCSCGNKTISPSAEKSTKKPDQKPNEKPNTKSNEKSDKESNKNPNKESNVNTDKESGKKPDQGSNVNADEDSDQELEHGPDVNTDEESNEELEHGLNVHADEEFDKKYNEESSVKTDEAYDEKLDVNSDVNSGQSFDKEPTSLINATNQQYYVESVSYILPTPCRQPAQLTLDNAATEVNQYLQALQKIPADYRIQHQEQYQSTGKRLLQQIEELKKSQKRAYRIADRNFLYNIDISSQGMCLLHQQMKNHKEQLKSLRDLRARLLQNLHFKQEELQACNVKIKPSNCIEDDEIDSSDEEKLTYSRGELAFRKGGLQGIQQGILGFPRHFLESLQSMLLDKSSTIDKMADYLVDTPDVSDKIADYMDSIEGNEEEKGKEIGEWITSQLLVGISEIYQAYFIKYIGKVKLIKALLKIVRAKHKQDTKLHKLTQKGLKQLGKLAAYKDQSAQEVFNLCKSNPPIPFVQHKSYWHKSLSELANLVAKDDADAGVIIEFLKKEL